MPLVVALVGGACAWFAFGRVATLGPSRVVPPARRDHGTAPTSTAVDVSVIVPARNEALSLPALLTSLARSTVTPREIIVVDDNSTDETSDIARRQGATVVVAPPPPNGWLGKPWACHLGSQRSTSARLLFLDADVQLAPEAISALLAHHSAPDAGLLSVQPFHRPGRWYEQLSAVFNIVGPMGSGAFALRRARAQRTAFGPCLLTTAADYEAAGGHAAVREEVIEDIALAARFDDAGRQVRVLLGGDLVSFRMYPAGLRSLVDGWTKNIAAGASRAHRPSSIAASVWVAAISSVGVSGVVGLVSWLRGGEAPRVELAAWVVAAIQVHVLLRRVGQFHVLTSVLFPLPLAFFIAVFLRSVGRLLLGRPVRWRDRDVPTRPAGASSE